MPSIPHTIPIYPLFSTPSSLRPPPPFPNSRELIILLRYTDEMDEDHSHTVNAEEVEAYLESITEEIETKLVHSRSFDAVE